MRCLQVVAKKIFRHLIEDYSKDTTLTVTYIPSIPTRRSQIFPLCSWYNLPNIFVKPGVSKNAYEINKGGVHICRVANGDLTWENLTYPKSHTQWYIVRTTLEGPDSISCGQYLDRTLGKFPPLYGPHLFFYTNW